MSSRSEYFACKLVETGIDEIPAMKAGRVLEYYERNFEDGEFPSLQRLPRIWRGMRVKGISPYFDPSLTVSREPSMTGEDPWIYHELDSIAIGVAVGIERGLLNVCEHTQYAISAQGVRFFNT